MTDEPRQLLIVEDDESFSRTLRRSFERRGYQVLAAHSHDQMVELLETHHPDYAVVDLKLGTSSGLTCVQTLHAFDPDARYGRGDEQLHGQHHQQLHA